MEAEPAVPLKIAFVLNLKQLHEAIVLFRDGQLNMIYIAGPNMGYLRNICQGHGLKEEHIALGKSTRLGKLSAFSETIKQWVMEDNGSPSKYIPLIIVIPTWYKFIFYWYWYKWVLVPWAWEVMRFISPFGGK